MKSDLIVLEVVTGLGIGGAERVVLDLSAGLAERGVRVEIVGLGSGTEIVGASAASRVPVTSLGVTRAPWKTLLALCRWISIVRRLRPNVIHAHMFHAVVFALLARLVHPASRVVFTSHNGGAAFRRLRKAVVRATRFLRAADVIFAPNQHSWLNASRVAVIPNGTGTVGRHGERTRPVGPPWVLICVARLVREKAPVQLVREFARLGRADTELWLVGTGDLWQEVHDEARRCNVSDRVKFLGARRDVPDLLARAHLFVLASVAEGMPIAVLEAGAHGVPVLATPVGSIPAVLSEGCGYVAPCEAFAEAIDDILEHYPHAMERARRFETRVRTRYSMGNAVDSHLALYHQVALDETRERAWT